MNEMMLELPSIFGIWLQLLYHRYFCPDVIQGPIFCIPFEFAQPEMKKRC